MVLYITICNRDLSFQLRLLPKSYVSCTLHILSLTLVIGERPHEDKEIIGRTGHSDKRGNFEIR